MDSRTPERLFHSHPCIETSAEVWAVLFARHRDDLEPSSSFSDPHGTQFGGAGTHGRMETVYRVRGADFPILGAKTTWEIGDKPHERLNSRTEYFLMIARNDADE